MVKGIDKNGLRIVADVSQRDAAVDQQKQGSKACSRFMDLFEYGSPLDVPKKAEYLRAMVQCKHEKVCLPARTYYFMLFVDKIIGTEHEAHETATLHELMMKESTDNEFRVWIAQLIWRDFYEEQEGSDLIHEGTTFSDIVHRVEVLRTLTAFDRSSDKYLGKYTALVSHEEFRGTQGLYDEAAALRGMLEKRLNSGEKLGWKLPLAYTAIMKNFLPGDGHAEREAEKAAHTLMRMFYSVHHGDRIKTIDLFKRNFASFKAIGFWRHALDTLDVSEIKISDQAKENLRGFTQQRHFVDHFDHWRNVLTVLSLCKYDTQQWTAPSAHGYRIVIDAVLKATDPAKWKSVRNTLRTFRHLELLNALPSSIVEKFYENWRPGGGDIRAALRKDIERTLLNYLKEHVHEGGPASMFFLEKAPSDAVARMNWQRAQRIGAVMITSGLMGTFATTAAFMDEEGREVLEALLDDLAQADVVEGKLVYEGRYRRMADSLNFSDDFVGRWKSNWRTAMEITSGEEGKEEMIASLIAQTIGQLTAHIGETEKAKGNLEDLPDAVHTLIAKLEANQVDRPGIKTLWQRFEKDYGAIRETYGDLFANMRTDLKNLYAGLTKEVRESRSEGVEITGDIEVLAHHGMVPVATCQRLTELYSENTNGRGQPLNRLLWGQFKVANYEVDGQVVARRIIEATTDGYGDEHLLVERLYVAGAFVRQKEFDEAIVEHGAAIGIPADRIHFLDRQSDVGIPLPLMTGAEIYRDSNLDEVCPSALRCATLPDPLFASARTFMPARVSSPSMSPRITR